MSIRCLLLICALCSADTVFAQTLVAPQTQIKLTIQAGCRILQNGGLSGTNHLGELSFGNIYQLNTLRNGEAATSNSQISVQCTKGTNAKLTLNKGNWGSSINDRKLKHSNNNIFLPYQIYTNPTRTLQWDDITGLPLQFSLGETKSIHFYGTLFAAPTAPAGYYQDTLTFTLSY